MIGETDDVTWLKLGIVKRSVLSIAVGAHTQSNNKTSKCVKVDGNQGCSWIKQVHKLLNKSQLHTLV